MVGAVVVQAETIVGEGYHEQYGGPHAEVHALAVAGQNAKGATLYVTLEPCCHQGKTPPCTQAIIAAGIREVVAAGPDPFAQVSGKGFEELRRAGIHVTSGFYRDAAERLNSPYFKLVQRRMPFVIAKWAMTLDGRIATSSGDSKWISNETSRARVHELRGRVDAILTGIGTVLHDNPMLTARPPGARQATRVVLDSNLNISLDSQLVKTARDIPVCIAHHSQDVARLEALTKAGCECLYLDSTDYRQRVVELMQYLGSKRMTNVLLEGGGRMMGACFDAEVVDEVWTFIAPKLLASLQARSPLEGVGIQTMAQAWLLDQITVEQLESDVLIRGRCQVR